ncbi:hypothetical protein CsatA_000099 [Cannabis sativa]
MLCMLSKTATRMTQTELKERKSLTMRVFIEKRVITEIPSSITFLRRRFLNSAYKEFSYMFLFDSLRRSSKLETEMRKIANQIVINSSETRFCSCVEAKAANCCRKCVLSQISDGLGKQGYNASLCKSTSRSSDQFLFGQHKFVDVVENIGKNRTKEVRVIIEVNLRSEFEMSSGLVSTEEYKELVQLLPELYIGKAERLDMVINIMCLAAKMCMKHNNMHLAPWRTYQYMCAKWLGPYKRDKSSLIDINDLLFFSKTSNNTSQKRVSMLTLDLQNMLPNNPLAV